MTADKRRVALVREISGYAGISAPFAPEIEWPELADRPIAEPSPTNPVFAAVRAALRALELDASRFGSREWNPLGDLVRPGGTVVLKPNFIRHWNPMQGRGGTVESVITHGAVVRAVADYAFRAVGETGKVILAEAPQQDCDFGEIRRLAGLDAVQESFARTGRELEVIDLRREQVVFRDGVIVRREALPGDPRGYRAVDLKRRSFFEGSGLEPKLFRGADYDPGPTTKHHRDGRNAYLLSETVLSADLVVNLPKLKTHKKTGVTLALKNLVGINGDKNWLPHHSAGAPHEGGDEFPGGKVDRWRNRALDRARPLLASGRMRWLFRAARRMEERARGDDFIRAGNWHGNRTTWRMCCDLNRCLYYSNAEGLHLDAPEPVRTVLTILDGIVAGEGNGPLAPTDVPLGALIAGLDPIGVDLVATRLMGFEPGRIPKIRGPMEDTGPRITSIRSAAEVQLVEASATSFVYEKRELADLTCARPFEPHPGWVGHIEAGRAVQAAS